MDDANSNPSLENRDPKNIDKKSFHPMADDKNFVALTVRGSKPFLACGAKSKNKKKGDLCHMPAGFGTAHMGYGRCKYHGGTSTGPITEEGKAKAAKNSKIHGFYAAALSPEEAAIFNELVEQDDTGLKFEIMALKSKILVYLQKNRRKWEEVFKSQGEKKADDAIKVWYATGENGQGIRSYYHAGSIDDRALDRALNTLGRLVEKHARLTGEDSSDLVKQINEELKGASYGQVSLSWGGKAQTRQQKGAEDNGGE